MILLVGLIYSCENTTKENHDHEQAEKVVKAEEHHESENNGIVLDNGKRWIANPETTAGIENMINILNSFNEKENVEAYGKLTEELKSEFTMIFEKCTMTGEAHNQLHHFLVPIKNLLETLPSSDLKQCQESFGNLNKHLAKYNEYFK